MAVIAGHGAPGIVGRFSGCMVIGVFTNGNINRSDLMYLKMTGFTKDGGQIQ